MLAAALAFAVPAHAQGGLGLDGLSLEIGSGQGTDLWRAGAQWKWQKKWLTGEAWQLGGYWELSAGTWDNPRGSVADFAFTPVFRLAPASAAGPYLEGGIGLHYLSRVPVRNGTELGGHVQFGSHAGAGLRFGERARYDLGARLQHLSNAGLEKPNPGINFLLLRFQVHLD